jgi:hypothetical protein
VDAIFVARHQTDGSFAGAGAIELGLHRELVERLEIRLAELPARRRGVVAWYPAEVSVVASLQTGRCVMRCCARCWTARSPQCKRNGTSSYWRMGGARRRAGRDAL